MIQRTIKTNSHYYMKSFTVLLLLTILACNDQPKKTSAPDKRVTDTSPVVSTVNNQTGKEICWTGTINGKTPVFLHYKQDGNLLIGEINYLNTKNKLPIILAGTLEKDKSYRLLEFERSGNITGIITGSTTDTAFNGTWFSPKSSKELALVLIKKDTVLNSVAMATNVQDVFGHYHYQYTEEGYEGDLDITKLPNSKAAFGITCVTEAPGRNVAQIDDDTITLNTTQFVYKLPDTDSCEFRVKFYKGLAYIQYTKGGCKGQFGFNATIDGVFIKTK